MKYPLIHAATAWIGLGLFAAAQAEEPVKFSCSKAPGASCTYKPVVDSIGLFQLSCTNAAADPAPTVSVTSGPVLKCSSKVFPGAHTDVGCSDAGGVLVKKPGPQTIRIVATCNAK